MSNRSTCTRLTAGLTTNEEVAEYFAYRADDLIDALLTTGAMAAKADGSVDPAEEEDFAGFVHRHRNVLNTSKAEALDLFRERVRQLDTHYGADAAIASLRRVADRPDANLILEVAEQVVAADGYVSDRERQTLHTIRVVLSALRRTSGKTPVPEWAAQ